MPSPEAGAAGTVHRFVASRDDERTRIDVFLTRALPALSRSRIQHLIRDGHVTAGGRPAKPGLVLSAGLEIEIAIPASVPDTPAPESLPLQILYDDEDIVVINKAAGMVVHPAAGHADGTLVNALLHHVKGLSGIGGTERPGIVHRLDRGTSGVMVVAKHDRAHRDLAAQFHDRTVTKEYVALVWGQPAVGLTMERPIGRDPRHRQRMSSRTSRGRTALTTVTEVDSRHGVSLIRLTIGTGRTHQIRVHLSDAGFPVVGDALYGGTKQNLTGPTSVLSKLRRPFLHAARLGFTHPSHGRAVSFEADMDEEMKRVLATLGLEEEEEEKEKEKEKVRSTKYEVRSTE